MVRKDIFSNNKLFKTRDERFQENINNSIIRPNNITMIWDKVIILICTLQWNCIESRGYPSTFLI